MYKIEAVHTGTGYFNIYDTKNKKVIGFTRVGWKAKKVRGLLNQKGFRGNIPAFMFAGSRINFDENRLE